jgi:hypothetical protein
VVRLRTGHIVGPGVWQAIPILAVIRFDNDTKGGDLSDPLGSQSRAAAEIAAQFADRMSRDPDTAASFPLPNR